MPVVALTGGIGAGKSTVAARLASLGAVVVDADTLAREVVEPRQPALAAIRAAFGDRVITSDGRLDRPALAAVVFSDAAALHILNDIVHPAVVQRSKTLFEQALSADRRAIVVYDVPLIDARGIGEFDRIVVVEAPVETRVRRLVDGRAMQEADARARIAAQLDDDARRALATDLIDASGSLDETARQVDLLWQDLGGDRHQGVTR